jgi:hypothetical protein
LRQRSGQQALAAGLVHGGHQQRRGMLRILVGPDLHLWSNWRACGVAWPTAAYEPSKPALVNPPSLEDPTCSTTRDASVGRDRQGPPQRSGRHSHRKVHRFPAQLRLPRQAVRPNASQLVSLLIAPAVTFEKRSNICRESLLFFLRMLQTNVRGRPPKFDEQLERVQHGWTGSTA